MMLRNIINIRNYAELFVKIHYGKEICKVWIAIKY